MTKVSRSPIFATCGLLFGAASAVQADGSYFQIDLAPNTSDVVAAATRGKLSFGANYSSYKNG